MTLALAPEAAELHLRYRRISEDRSGDGEGVERQDDILAGLMGPHGAGALDFVDNDVSATSGRVRPDWKRFVATVKGHPGPVVVWCYATDRLTRTPREMEDVIDLAEAHGLTIRAAKDSTMDLNTSGGRAMARIVVAMARQEHERKQERLRDQRQQAAEKGRPHSGGRRPFGYTDDRMALVPAEATLVREAAQRVIAGESLNSVARDWNERGLPTPTGAPRWRSETIGSILRSPRIVGEREHKGARHDGTWPAIITKDEQERLGLRLDATKGVRRTDGRNRHLLSGLLVCGKCGNPLVGHTGSSKYVCKRFPHRPDACQGIGVSLLTVEQSIIETFLGFLSAPEMAGTLDTPEVPVDVTLLLRSLEEDQADLIEYARMRARKELSPDEHGAMKSEVESRMKATRAQLERLDSRTARRATAAEDILARWNEASVGQRQEWLGMYLDRIVVKPVGKASGRRFNPERLEFVWNA